MRGRLLVKAADLGYISSNLQDIPSEEEKKEKRLAQALSNLTSPEPPERLSRTQLPEKLLNLMGE